MIDLTRPECEGEVAELNRAIEGVTVPSLFLKTVAVRGGETALRHSAEAGETALTWGQYSDRVARAVTGLAELGLAPGDRVCLMMRNIPEFHIVDLALKFLRLCPVSIYNSSSVQQITYIADHCRARLMIVEPPFLERAQQAAERLEMLQAVIVVGGGEPVARTTAWESVVEREPSDLAALAAEVATEDLATIIYTSGSTGPPKGVMLTHRNIAWQTEAMSRRIELPMQGWRQISYLPMAHIGERMMGHYLAIKGGTEVTCCVDPAKVGEKLPVVRPHIFLGMPRMWEKLHAELVGVTGSDRLDSVDRAELLKKVGLENGRIMLTSGGVLDSRIHEFFRRLDLPLSDIYGMSESTGPICWSPHDPLPGCVGYAMPGCELRLEDDGEIVFRSGCAFAGYLDDPERTAELDAGDGWIRTGDIGKLDPSGQLRIIDRKKEIIITAGGKNISPASLEKALKAQPLIGQAVAVGDARKFVSALIVLDPQAAAEWAVEHGLPADTPIADLVEMPELRQDVEAAVERANEEFSQVEKIKRFVILSDVWLPDSDELTPTAKLRRRVVNEKYADVIAEMYEEREREESR